MFQSLARTVQDANPFQFCINIHGTKRRDRLLQKDQPVNAFYGNNGRMLWQSYAIRECVVWELGSFKGPQQEVRVFRSGL